MNTRTPCATPIRLTPITHSQSRSVCSQIRPPAPTPALLKTKCGAPKRSIVAAPSASTSAALRHVELQRQHLRAERLQISAGARSSASACTSATTTFMPRRAHSRASSRPKPEPAPVMTAVSPRPRCLSLILWVPSRGFDRSVRHRTRQQGIERRARVEQAEGAATAELVVQPRCAEGVEHCGRRVLLQQRGLHHQRHVARQAARRRFVGGAVDARRQAGGQARRARRWRRARAAARASAHRPPGRCAARAAGRAP